MLAVAGLKVHYDGIEALRGVDIAVGEAEMVALIGSNGAGKSTLLRTISGLVGASDGTVEFDGRSILGREPERVARDGLVQVPEGRHVFPRLSVRDNLLVAAWGRRSGVAEDLERVQGLFPILAERDGQLAYTLSGGEQQMLALGRALMRRPRLLMLDEPSMGLAPKITHEVFELIRRIHADGTPVLLVEQNARAALELADRGYVIASGRIVAEGPAGDLAASDEVRKAYLGEVG
jgi:branched-chain amino acid transport system ATP-binding protein